ncbi:acyl-CoA dehydrogenase family protein [Herbaspirillum sp. RV1423]|uniref:acyl-CoA dehydrogenase family protein n=1 Tax=Herbaspirillum sp. RV1423 TaxID=1443993 RepID=UPI0012DD5DA6|nr:acyl-CoA dehydrogenase family protein [Herbaspirillum sp. RV1423]
MITAARQTAPTLSPGQTALDDVIAEIAARRDEFDRLSHVPKDVIQRLKQARVFRASTPKRFGGDALAPHLFFDIVERIAVADGSASWVAGFGSANVYLAALPLETQAILYAEGPDQVFAGALYPVQPAARMGHGWQVSGRWKFASGCKGADWLGVGIGGPNNGGQAGKPLTAVFRPDQVTIVDNWNVVGMQGTGSHDLQVNDRYVDDVWTFVRGSAALVDEPLYRYPAVSYQAGVHAAVNLGLARAALNELTAMSSGRATTTGAPRLADRPHFRIELARAEAQLRSARAFFFEAAEQAWDVIAAGDVLSLEQNNLLRMSAIHAAHAAAEVVQQCYKLGGIAAIYRQHPLQRIVRDSMVVTQHAFLGESAYDGAGAVLAGVPPFAGYP